MGWIKKPPSEFSCETSSCCQCVLLSCAVVCFVVFNVGKLILFLVPTRVLTVASRKPLEWAEQRSNPRSFYEEQKKSWEVSEELQVTKKNAG